MTIFSLQWSDWIRNKIKSMYRTMSRFSLGFMPHHTETIGNTTTSTISALPEELVVEILSRLPPMALFRCRSVCNSWLSHFSDAFHLNKQLQTNMTGLLHNSRLGDSSPIGFTSLLSDADMVKFPITTICVLPSPRRLRILDCCNGILLVGTVSKELPFLDDIFAYNPATQTLINIGFSKFIKKHCAQSFSLAFDTQASSLFHFINFSSCIINGSQILQIDLFSFDRDKNKCKHKKLLLPRMSINNLCKITFFNGRVHRLTSENKILTIDPIKCSYYMIQQPDWEGHNSVEVGHSQGHLHCVTTNYLDKGLSIWFLKSYAQQEWTLKYRLSFQQISAAPNIDYGNFFDQIFLKRFAFHPQEDKPFLLLQYIGFVSFSWSSGKIEKLAELYDYNYFFDCWSYMPCYLV